MKEIFKLQEELDKRIESIHGEADINDIYLATIVEICELANATRCFKKWSVKPPESKEVISEELADVFHFLVSISLKYGITDIHNLNIERFEKSENLTVSFLGVISEVIGIYYHKRWKSDNITMRQIILLSWWQFEKLVNDLGFTEEELKGFYKNKNKKNHERQNNKY